MDIRSGSITPPRSPLVGRTCDVEDDVELAKEPYLGQVEPYLGQVEPYLGQVEPYLGQVFYCYFLCLT